MRILGHRAYWIILLAFFAPNLALGTEDAIVAGDQAPTLNQSAQLARPAVEEGVVLIDQYGRPLTADRPPTAGPMVSEDNRAATSGPDGASLAKKNPPVSLPTFDLNRLWFDEAQGDLLTRARAARTRADEFGVRDLNAVARAVLLNAQAGDELLRAKLASELAPDLPMAQMALVKALWKEHGVSKKLFQAFSRAVSATTSNLEASIWLEATLLRNLAWMLALGAIAYCLLVFGRAIPFLMHDLADFFPREIPAFGRLLLVGFVLLLPVSLGEPIFGVCLVCGFVGLYYGSWRQRAVLVVAFAMWFIALFGIAPHAAQRLEVLGSDSIEQLAYDASYGWLSDVRAQRLATEAESNLLAREAYGYWLSHRGELEKADSLLAEFVSGQRGMVPAFLLNNAANIKRGLHRAPEAVALYEKAAKRLTEEGGSRHDRAIVAFNLARAYSDSFQLSEHEEALQRAQTLSEATVTELLMRGGGEQGKGVDLLPSARVFRSKLLLEAEGPLPNLPIQRILRIGWISQTSERGFLSLGVLALLACSLALWRPGSFRCSSCGRYCCPRCQDESKGEEELCITCARLLRRPETIDVGLRVEKISELSLWNKRRARRDTVLALLVPGVAGLIVRRPFLAFFSVLAAVLVPIAWGAGTTGLADPMLLGGVEQLILTGIGTAAFVIYGMTLAIGVSLRRYA